jgi:hypothetical protein
MTEVLKHAALAYADDGWQIFPVFGITNGKCDCGVKCDSPGKHPLVKWTEAATDDHEQIERWWNRWPNANIGVATGRKSGLYVLDLDNKRSIDLGGGTLVSEGVHSLHQQELTTGKLPDTRSQTTGSGGTHLIFSYPDSESPLPNRGGLLPSLDTRGDGGYIVAPPSLHPSGNRYRWDDQDQPVATLPSAWTQFVVNEQGAKSSLDLEIAPDFQILEGEGRHQWLFRMASKLHGQHGLPPMALYGALTAYNRSVCNPPLDSSYVEHVVEQVQQYPREVMLDRGIAEIPEIDEGDDVAILLSDFMDDEPPPFIPLVRSLLNSGESMILGGPPNIGKTWAVMDMMMGISSGSYFANHFSCEAVPVLFIDEEGSRRGDWERFQMLLSGRDDRSAVEFPVRTKIDSGIRLDDPKGHVRLARLIERYKPGAVFLDSLVRVHGGNESDNRAMADFFQIVKQLMSTYGTSFIFTHHIRKPGKDAEENPLWMLRGASDIQGFPDSIAIFLPTGDTSRIKVVHTKMRNGAKLPSFDLKLLIEDDDSLDKPRAKVGYAESEPEEQSGKAQVLSAILAAGIEVSTEHIASVTGLALRTVTNHIKVLQAEGKIASEKSEGKWWHQEAFLE